LKGDGTATVLTKQYYFSSSAMAIDSLE